MATITKVEVSLFCYVCEKVEVIPVDIPPNTHSNHIEGIISETLKKKGWVTVNLNRSYDRCSCEDPPRNQRRSRSVPAEMGE